MPGSRRTTVPAAHADPLPASVLHHARGRGWHALVRVRAPVRGPRSRGADGNRGLRQQRGGRHRGGGRARRLLRLRERHRHAPTRAGCWPSRASRSPPRCTRCAGRAPTWSTPPRRRSRSRCPALLAAARHRAPLVFEVRDLWPEAPIQMGALRNPLARRLARALERFVYSPQRARDRALAGHPRRRRGGRRARPSGSRSCRTPPTSSCSPRRSTATPSARGSGSATGSCAATSARWARPTTSPRSCAPRRSCDGVTFVLLGDGKQRAELEREARAARSRQRACSCDPAPDKDDRGPAGRGVGRLPHDLQGRARAGHQLAQQAVRHLRGGPAGDREPARLDARARGAQRGRPVRAPRRPRRPGREGRLAARPPATRPSATAATRARWPSASSTATRSPRARWRCWRRRPADRALLLRGEHERARAPARLPRRDRAHAPAGRGARGARARQRLRRRLGGGGARSASGRAPDRARAARGQGGERLAAAARGRAAATACC